MRIRSFVRLRQVLAPTVALAGAAFLSLTGSGEAYAFLGGSLDLGQRDFRVFDNFSDPEVNDNVTPHPAFPGHVGAVRAIWAGVAEWGSELRRDGSGDPHQPFDLGSGGANFDSTFQGLATDPGGTDDNIFSEITGNSGGVLAFTELPISDGWRIRVYKAPWVMHDGPGPPPSGANEKDMQGVAAHEYGHALGLDHSTNSIDNTMFPGTFGNLYDKRSLAPDDIAGVQALYGVRSLNKPHISSYELAGGQLTIHGTNFDANDNEVWFTRGSGIGDGTPVKATAIASSASGTRIDVAIPLEAGSGDLLIRVPGTTGDKLSNSYPLDLVLGECPLVEVYGTPKVNSNLQSTSLLPSGIPSVTINTFAIDVNFTGYSSAPGILFHGTAQAATPFMGGTLYSSGPFVRDQHFVFDFFGSVHLPIAVNPAMVGQTHYYQIWYQDPGDPFGVGLSDAVKVVFCP